MSSPDLEEPSGLTIDGIRIPIRIEAEGPAATVAFLAGTAPVVIETPANPPTHAEGSES